MLLHRPGMEELLGRREVDLSSSNVGPQVVRAYLSQQHFEDVENSCPMVALPTDVARCDQNAKRAFETVFHAMVQRARKKFNPKRQASPRDSSGDRCFVCRRHGGGSRHAESRNSRRTARGLHVRGAEARRLAGRAKIAQGTFQNTARALRKPARLTLKTGLSTQHFERIRPGREASLTVQLITAVKKLRPEYRGFRVYEKSGPAVVMESPQGEPSIAYAQGENKMNWDQLQGKWKQTQGKVREKWGKLTDDDLDVIAGKRDQLVGRIQERYGMAREEAEKQADAFVKGLAEGQRPLVIGSSHSKFGPDPQRTSPRQKE